MSDDELNPYEKGLHEEIDRLEAKLADKEAECRYLRCASRGDLQPRGATAWWRTGRDRAGL